MVHIDFYPLPDDAREFFQERTNSHIRRVRDNISLMIMNYGNLKIQLEERAECHDQSKFMHPENVPYIWRTWLDHCIKTKKIIELNKDFNTRLDQAVRDAIFHHVTHNRHHPEWHPDPDNMSKVDLIEMVCDWKAMSQEFNQGSPHAFASTVLGRRFQFSEGKIMEIRLLIDEVDDLNNNYQK